jgi:hypothetical protein
LGELTVQRHSRKAQCSQNERHSSCIMNCASEDDDGVLSKRIAKIHEMCIFFFERYEEVVLKEGGNSLIPGFFIRAIDWRYFQIGSRKLTFPKLPLSQG